LLFLIGCHVCVATCDPRAASYVDGPLGWLPMERNLRKRNLRQPIKSSLLPYARFESGS